MGNASARAVDFSNVKERGDFNPHRVEAGDYAAIITKVEDSEVKSGDNKGDFMYVFTIKLQKYSQYTYPYRCKITENQLWKLRNIAVAAGLNVPKKRMKFDPNKVVGKLIGVTLEDDEYEKNGKMVDKSEVSAVFPASELADGADIDDSDEAFDEGSDDDGPVAVAAGDDDDAAEEEAPKKKKKDKGAKAEKGGKKKKKKGSDDIQELDVSDIG